jgi:hypothetical protein
MTYTQNNKQCLYKQPFNISNFRHLNASHQNHRPLGHLRKYKHGGPYTRHRKATGDTEGWNLHKKNAITQAAASKMGLFLTVARPSFLIHNAF